MLTDALKPPMPDYTSGMFGLQGNALPNAHDIFIQKIKPMIVEEENVNGIGLMSDGVAAGLVGGSIIVLAAFSFLWGKYIGSWAVETISETKLTDKQKTAIGIASVILI